jgi:hypothetical protein
MKKGVLGIIVFSFKKVKIRKRNGENGARMISQFYKDKKSTKLLIFVDFLWCILKYKVADHGHKQNTNDNSQ